MKTLRQGVVAQEMLLRMSTLCVEDGAFWGVMSVGEMVRHVDGAFRMAMGEAAVAPAPSPLPGAVLKWMALRLPVRWKQGFPTVPELRVGAEQMQVGAFEADREALLASARRFCTLQEVRTDHPMFGAMTTRDWMRWGYLHTDHHLRQFGR